MINKRGLSEIVATVMIILLTIIAISLIAAFVVPFVRNSLQKSSECLNYKDYFVFDESFGLNCYQGSLAGISVKANGDSSLANDIGGFKLVVASKDGSSKGVNVEIGKNTSDKTIGNIWIINEAVNIEIPAGGETISYVYNSTGGDLSSASIYPLLKSGRVCSEGDTVQLAACGAGVTLK